MPTYPTTGTLDAGAIAKPFLSKVPFVIEKIFDLDALLSGKLAAADVANLFSLPAKTMVISAVLECKVAQAGGTGLTLKLRAGTTDLTAAQAQDSATVNASTATYVGAAAANINLLAALTSGTVTKNPTVKVTLVCYDAS